MKSVHNCNNSRLNLCLWLAPYPNYRFSINYCCKLVHIFRVHDREFLGWNTVRFHPRDQVIKVVLTMQLIYSVVIVMMMIHVIICTDDDTSVEDETSEPGSQDYDVKQFYIIFVPKRRCPPRMRRNHRGVCRFISW